MKNYLRLLYCLFVASSAFANSHEEAAFAYISAANLKVEWNANRDAVSQRIGETSRQLSALPIVKDNPEAQSLVIQFTADLKEIAADEYSWENFEKRYVETLIDIYTEEELTNIAEWLSSKHGKIFVSRQKDFLIKTELINDYVRDQFRERVASAETEFKKNVENLAESP